MRYRLSPEVSDALAAFRPVVALESTVFIHGLPRPGNAGFARELEQVVRNEGAVPATIAVVDGVPRVGLESTEIDRLASAEGVEKVSTRDLPVVMATGRCGGTTVAATAFIAHAAGIHVFATGGIGGVHRGLPIDVSADLMQLSHTPLVVVCSGAKSILDLPSTREILETLGVLVVGWQTSELPAFFSRESGLSVDIRVETPEEVAAIWRAQRECGLVSAILTTVPAPEQNAIPAAHMDELIISVLEGAARAGVRGKAVTPYLLAEIRDLTGNASLETNIALLRNNAGVAARIARALAS